MFIEYFIIQISNSFQTSFSARNHYPFPTKLKKEPKITKMNQI